MNYSLLGLPLEKLGELHVSIPNSYAFSNDLLLTQITSWQDQYQSINMSIHYRHSSGHKKHLEYPLSSLSQDYPKLFSDIEKLKIDQYTPYDISVGKIITVGDRTHYLPFTKLQHFERSLFLAIFWMPIDYPTGYIARESKLSWTTTKKYLESLHKKGYVLKQPVGNRTHWISRRLYLKFSPEQQKEWH